MTSTPRLYIPTVNAHLRTALVERGPTVIYGQNITKGSSLAGLTANLSGLPGVTAIDTPNCENALIGMGFGLALDGKNAVFAVKQLDFVLLGIDHIVNTWNILRTEKTVRGSFTILNIVVDSGFEGPQSRFNGLADICSLADADGFCVSDADHAGVLFDRHLLTPGFRLMSVSQRLFRSPVPDQVPERIAIGGAGDIVRYGPQGSVAVVSFNFALPQARTIAEAITSTGRSVAVTNVFAASRTDWSDLVADCRSCAAVVLVDDSRSRHRAGRDFHLALRQSGTPVRIVVCERDLKADDIAPNADAFVPDVSAIMDGLKDA
jgi:pyruvate/2-oxoglutarate/acetoin dehydrogenase E1 component